MQHKDSEPFWGTIGGFTVFALVVVVLWSLNFLLYPMVYGEPENVGVAGDMFGAVTALFSGLAFAGLVSTLLMQRLELSMQRNEIVLQRKELEYTREEFTLQRFESTLFGLIKMFNDHVNSLERTHHGKIIKGREVIKIIAADLPDENYIPRRVLFDPNSPAPGPKVRRSRPFGNSRNRFSHILS